MKTARSINARDSDGWYEFLMSQGGLLIRNEPNSPPENLVFIGTGAEQNAWQPLFDCYGYGSALNPNPKLFIGQMLARSVSIARMNYEMLAAGHDTFPDASIGRLLNTRVRIGELYNQPEYRDTITLRTPDNIPSFQTLLKDETTHFVTTNWDTTIGRTLNPKSLIYLHGNVDFPQTLVFPTEQHFERYRSVEAALRPPGINPLKELHMAHQLAFAWLMKAKNIYFWGLNINEYDFDINAMLKFYDKKNMYVVNPCSQSAYYLSYINDLPVTHIDPLSGTENIVYAEDSELFEVIYCGNKIKRSAKSENYEVNMTMQKYKQVKQLNRKRKVNSNKT